MNQLFITPLFTLLNAAKGDMGYLTILNEGNDPSGVIVALISISVVLSSLIVLGFLIWLFSKAMIYSAKRQSEIARKKALKTTDVVLSDEVEENGEIIAAIALALKLNKAALHDKESEVITINSVARSYSPWSSKIHGLTQLPR